MKKVSRITGRAFPLGAENIDTDMIIPARYMKTISRAGLARGAFEMLRAVPGNVFDDPVYAGSTILIAGRNFGCGSSREHAVWALADMGLEAIIAPSFSDIFSGNAVKNGIVTATLPQAAIDCLLVAARQGAITVDLEEQQVSTPAGDCYNFGIDPFARDCLLNGLDEIEITLSMAHRIADFEARTARDRPWLLWQQTSA